MEMKLRLFSVSDAARFLERSADSVRGLTRTGALPCIKTVGGVRLFTQATLERFARENPHRSGRSQKEKWCGDS